MCSRHFLHFINSLVKNVIAVSAGVIEIIKPVYDFKA